MAICATRTLGLFVERGGGGAALALSADLGSCGLTGVEGMLLDSPLESDGRHRRDVGVEGGFPSEGDGDGELGELGFRESDVTGIARRVGVFWGIASDGTLGC